MPAAPFRLRYREMLDLQMCLIKNLRILVPVETIEVLAKAYSTNLSLALYQDLDSDIWRM